MTPGRRPQAILVLALVLVACAADPPVSVDVASPSPPASDGPPDEPGAWPAGGVGLEDGSLSLDQARGIARAIGRHFAEPATIERFGAELAARCGDVREPFVPEPGLARLGPWLLTERSTATCTYDLGHGSGTRRWIDVSLAYDEPEPRVTGSSNGHAHGR